VREISVSAKDAAGAGRWSSLACGSLVEDLVVVFAFEFPAKVARRRSRVESSKSGSAESNHPNVQLTGEEMNICAIFPLAEGLSAPRPVGRRCIHGISLTLSASYRRNHC
jgi:hypothetical protein